MKKKWPLVLKVFVLGVLLVGLGGMLLPYRRRDPLHATRVTVAKGDCRTLKAALESYAIYNQGSYPTEDEGLALLPSQQRRWIFKKSLEDPYALNDGDPYQYATDEAFHTDSEGNVEAYYWVVWSVGPKGSCQADFVDGEGTLVMNDASAATVVHGIRGKDPGVPTVDQIAFDTNAKVIYVYALEDSEIIGIETPTPSP